MRKTIVRIPQPCAESWATMTPTATGRHCAACQQVVVDFTQQTDAEILSYLARSSGHTCGRLRTNQLGRPLVLPTEPKRWRAWLAALLTAGGLLASERASAQRAAQQSDGGPVPIATQPAATPESIAPANLAPPATAALTDSPEPLTLRGVVTDASNNTIPGATVLLKGTAQGTSTNANGEFTLPLNGNASGLVLVVSFVGFVTHEQPIVTGAIGAAAPVHVKLEDSVTGQLISPRPYPWHPRAFFSWGKYWLTRPFRGY